MYRLKTKKKQRRRKKQCCPLMKRAHWGGKKKNKKTNTDLDTRGNIIMSSDTWVEELDCTRPIEMQMRLAGNISWRRDKKSQRN